MSEPTICRFDKSILEKKATGKIEALEDVFLTEHLKGCPECREYLRKKKQEKLQEKQKKLSLKNRFSSIKAQNQSVEAPSEEKTLASKKEENSGTDGSAQAEKPMKLAEVFFRGSTAGIRAIPVKAILSNIKNEYKKNKQKGGSGTWES